MPQSDSKLEFKENSMYVCIYHVCVCMYFFMSLDQVVTVMILYTSNWQQACLNSRRIQRASRSCACMYACCTFTFVHFHTCSSRKAELQREFGEHPDLMRVCMHVEHTHLYIFILAAQERQSYVAHWEHTHTCMHACMHSRFCSSRRTRLPDTWSTNTHTLHTHTCMHIFTPLQLKKDKAAWHLEWGQDRDEFAAVKRRIGSWLEECHKKYDIEISIESTLQRKDGKTMCVFVHIYLCMYVCMYVW